MRTLEYLDKAKVKLGIQSDYGLAKQLKISESTMSSYRAGRSRMDDEVALKVAKMLEIDPIETIAAANLERAKTEEQRAVWSTLLEKISKGFDDLLSGSHPHGTELPVCR